MKAQTHIFVMTIDEAQANPDIVSSIMIIFSTPARVLFDSRSSRSFISNLFALHVDRELSLLKNKLVVMTLLVELFFVILFLRVVKFSYRVLF